MKEPKRSPKLRVTLRWLSHGGAATSEGSVAEGLHTLIDRIGTV